MQTAARVKKVDAVFALSSYLSDDSLVYDAELPPVFMGHGSRDTFIKTQWGEQTAARLKKQTTVDFRLYPLQHEFNRNELNDVISFLTNTIT